MMFRSLVMYSPGNRVIVDRSQFINVTKLEISAANYLQFTGSKIRGESEESSFLRTTDVHQVEFSNLTTVENVVWQTENVGSIFVTNNSAMNVVFEAGGKDYRDRNAGKLLYTHCPDTSVTVCSSSDLNNRSDETFELKELLGVGNFKLSSG